MSNLFENTYNPDVVECLANLSNDEVFTPPELANKMIDLLPQELFSDPNTTFLDPACKSGIFLREIAKRLIVGLEDKIPDLQERLDHIYQKQLYGIAITELTSLLSRRSLYYTKYPTSVLSVSQFDNIEGNILFHSIKHTWNKNRCKYCGASQKEFDRGDELESHAYEFIHTKKSEEIFNMKFDVIIGNPPYQLDVGNEGGNKSKAKAIYHHFIDQAIKLDPKYIVMITPSRWMTKSAEGIPDRWIKKMLSEGRIKEIYDFEDSNDCFPGLSIMGGVNYFLWDKNYCGDCLYYYKRANSNKIEFRKGPLGYLDINLVIRDPKATEIVSKIVETEGDYYIDKNFSLLVSPKDFFTNKKTLTSSWNGYKQIADDKYNIKYYYNKSNKRESGWVNIKQISKNKDSINLIKVFIPAAYGGMEKILGDAFIGEKGSVCSQTYLVIGYDPKEHNFSEEECENIISYIRTKFFRYLVSIKKKTQNGPRGVYQFVPIQDFSKPWTDEELYKKYNFSQDEIDFIESMIKPMDEEEN